MLITMLTRYSPIKGQQLQAGAVVEVQDEIALDMIQRGVAVPMRTQAEHAVAPGQTNRGS